MNKYFSILLKSARFFAAQRPKIPGSGFRISGPGAHARGSTLKWQTRVYNIFLIGARARTSWPTGAAPAPAARLRPTLCPPQPSAPLRLRPRGLQALLGRSYGGNAVRRAFAVQVSPSRTPGSTAPGGSRRGRAWRSLTPNGSAFASSACV